MGFRARRWYRPVSAVPWPAPCPRSAAAVDGAHVRPRSPTLTNRKAILARSDRIRKSPARARAAPAPAAIPFTAAITGFCNSRMLRTDVAGKPGERLSPAPSIFRSSPMMPSTAAAGAETPAAPVRTTTCTRGPRPGSRSTPPTPHRYGTSGLELAGIVEADGGDAAVQLVVETLIFHSSTPGWSGHDRAAVNIDTLAGDGIARRPRQQHRRPPPPRPPPSAVRCGEERATFPAPPAWRRRPWRPCGARSRA